MLDKVKKIYELLPKEKLIFLRFIPDRVLFGKSYEKTKRKISYKTKDINKNLYETLNYAREHTLFGKDNIPKNFKMEESIKILESLPLISSHELATNLSYYVSDEFNKLNSYYTTTGGTGRNPTTLLLSNELYGIEWAYVQNIWSLADYNRKKNLKLTLRGKSLKGDKLVEYNPIYNELVVDTFKIKESNAEEFLEKISKYNIEYLYGYPSLVKEYISYFDRYNYKLKLKGVLLASEGVSVEDKKFIRDYFNCKVISFYGQSERALFAVDSDCSGNYKVATSYGYPRIIEGELVVTSFVNRALPLINYKMGDGADTYEKDGYIFLNNLSSRRGKDFIYLEKNKKISVAFGTLNIIIQNEILYYQIHQKEFGKLTFKILKKLTSRMDDTELIKIFKKEMQDLLKDFEINAFVVNSNEIIRSNRGKMILLVQDLDVS